MLGERIGEETGRITGQRVLPTEGGGPKVEVSFEGTGTLLGVEITDMGTYHSAVRPDGTLFGEGQGIIMTRDGEMASWKGQGVGRFTGRGAAVSWRGAIYYQTASQKLARLNSVAAIFEYEVAEDGKTVQSALWEWK
ncbi:MAG: hypothetical protein AB1801_17510 [Chloroflexota bacterium]